jgi:hypothetical protein
MIELAKFIQTTEPNIQGFSERNIWRMKQFYETYSNPEFLKLSAVLAEFQNATNLIDIKLATLWRELNWTKNEIIINRAKTKEEREHNNAKLIEILSMSFERSNSLLNPIKEGL